MDEEQEEQQVEKIAQVCHEANAAYCRTFGDGSHMPWAYALDRQRTRALEGVRFFRDNPKAPASAPHDAWVKEKLTDGWVHGEQEDAKANPPTHPSLVPFKELPIERQTKARLFRAIVLELLK